MDNSIQKTLINLALIGAAGFIVYKMLQKGKDQISTTVADWWVKLTAGAPIQLLGNIVLPDGTLIPIGNVQIRSDSAGNVFTLYQNIPYQLHPSDANGNWPATPVGG